MPVLIAEDDPNDALLLESALKKTKIPAEIHIVNDGEEVINYLTSQGSYSDPSVFLFPSVMFLDLKMPRMNGFEVLRWIKTHPEYKVIPTIILSSSNLDSDVWQSYELGANSYLVKPSSFDELARRISLAFDYWSICLLPDLPHKGILAIQ